MASSLALRNLVGENEILKLRRDMAKLRSDTQSLKEDISLSQKGIQVLLDDTGETQASIEFNKLTLDGLQ